MSLLGECLWPYMFLVLIRELNASYLHDIMYSIHYFQLKKGGEAINNTDISGSGYVMCFARIALSLLVCLCQVQKSSCF